MPKNLAASSTVKRSSLVIVIIVGLSLIFRPPFSGVNIPIGIIILVAVYKQCGFTRTYNLPTHRANRNRPDSIKGTTKFVTTGKNCLNIGVWYRHLKRGMF